MSYDAKGQAVYGRLQTDRPHVFKLQGVYDFKWGTTVGANWFVESGIPQSTAFRFSGFPVFPYGRNDLGRTPVLSQLDLNVSQEFRLAGRSRIQVQANIDNVFDQMTWTNYYLIVTQGPGPYRDSLSVANPPALSLYGASGAYSLDQRIADYKGTMRSNTFYKTPNVYQGRREMRLQFRITF